jgi:hypothetical protein
VSLTAPVPVDARPLFAPLGAELVALLRALPPEAWSLRATPRWTVQQVVAHLLDTSLRRLSFHRDGAPMPAPDTAIAGFGDAVGFINRLNDDWMRVAPRFSPAVLVELVEATDRALSAFFEGLPLEAPAFFDVGWAGTDASALWLDLGREYTERWHHQQQVREAAGAPLLTEPRWLAPVIEVAVRALPRAWAGVEAPEGTVVQLEITGPGGSAWALQRSPHGWALRAGRHPAPASVLTTDVDTAWRLWHKAIDPALVPARLRATGEARLTEPFARTLALMA